MITNAPKVLPQTLALDGYVCRLELAHRVPGVGGKAANLGSMLEQGINVPPGLVVTDKAFQQFLDENELRAPIAAQLEGLQPDQLSQLNSAAQTISRHVLAARIPIQVWKSIQELRRTLMPQAALAVRSSAVGEDSKQAAFAGQLDSILGVESDSELSQAILKCWASYWSPRVLFYQLSRNIHLQGMGVVIQELVDSHISGILFTQNPDSSANGSESMVAEYCFGLGEDLAAGKMNPGRFTISRNDRSWVREATPEQEDVGSDESLFHDRQIGDLTRSALKLEQHFDCGQDIEWTIDRSGELFLVQSRPITVAPSSQVTPKLPGADGPVAGPMVHWSNANVNENFPEPISPFLYSIASAGYYNYFRNLALAFGFDRQRVADLEYEFQNVIGVHGGRMYYNLSNIHKLLGAAPAGEHLCQWFDDFVGATKSDESDVASEAQPQRLKGLRKISELLRSGAKVTRQFVVLSRRVATFEREVDGFAAATHPEKLADKTLAMLLQDLRRFMDIRCNRWVNASLADTAAMVTYGLLKRTLTKEFPDRDQSGLHNSLLKGLQDVVSGIPVLELWKLSRMVRQDPELNKRLISGDDDSFLAEIRSNPEHAQFIEAFDTFLENWGFRCSGELMLTVPSFQERPEALLEMLRSYASLDGESPTELLQRQAADRIEETSEVLKKLRAKKFLWPLPWPSRATWVATIIRRCHQSIALRERARLKQALLYSRCRRIALAAANKMISQGWLEDRDDVFFLTFQELEALLAGGAMYAHQSIELIQLRKRGHEQLSEMVPEDSFLLPFGDYLPVMASKLDSKEEKISADSQTQLEGIGACGGKATAPAAILTDVSECHLLNQGDILVTRQTDPGWGPVFFLIKGLVMERGGMLSHGAILAREYGIPTVVGVRNATQRLSSGQSILVNGDRGVVQIVD